MKGIKKGSYTYRWYKFKIACLEAIKKFTSTILVVLMATAGLFTLAVYIYEMYLIWSQYYYVVRTYYTVEETIDFETLSSQKIRYFLYKNLTADARDADGENGLNYIDEHV